MGHEAIIGAGIYAVIGIVAGLAGPALVVSMILCSGSGPLHCLEPLERLHPVHATPHLAVWISGLLIALLVLLTDLEKIVAVSTFGLLFYYLLANVSDARLRLLGSKSRLLPVLGATSCLALLASLLLTTPYAWLWGYYIVLSAGGVYFMAKSRSRRINIS